MFSGLLYAQVPADVFGKSLIDLSVTRNGLLLAGSRIEVDIMLCTVPQQNTPRSCQLPQQGPALHRAMTFSPCSSGTSSMTIMR